MVIIVLVGVVAALYRAYRNPDELWAIVQSCAGARAQGHSLPVGCVSVDPISEVVILRSFFARWDFLAVPAMRVSGIEDPQLRSPQFPNVWAAAWSAANKYLPPRATKDRAHVGLAINSAVSRSENQLHIHISCVKPKVMTALDNAQGAIGTKWSQPFLHFARQDYRAMRVYGKTLDRANPFLLLMADPRASENMGLHTLVVIGASWDHGAKPGFYLLDGVAHSSSAGDDLAHGEDLLDEGCRRIAR